MDMKRALSSGPLKVDSKVRLSGSYSVQQLDFAMEFLRGGMKDFQLVYNSAPTLGKYLDDAKEKK